MRNRLFHAAAAAAIVALSLTGVYALLKPPAPKPLTPLAPGPAATQPEVEPIPGAPPFDQAKYRYEPQISVYMADKKTVETMPLEQYLEGVVAQEMDPGWPPEALAAQAIASRTLTLAAIEAGTIRKLHRADVSTAKEELQAFAPHKVNDAVKEAVGNTRGMALMYAGTLVQAIYSSCNGQIGAVKEESFPEEITAPAPYLQTVTDHCFDYAPAHIQSWTVKVGGDEAAAAIGYSGDPARISILEKGPSGRILYIGAGDKKVHGAEFRKRIGFDRLKSTLVTSMSYDGRQFTFTGQGWGNGVGLCQWGAYAYSLQGWKGVDIVRYYYPGAEVVKLWD